MVVMVGLVVWCVIPRSRAIRGGSKPSTPPARKALRIGPGTAGPASGKPGQEIVAMRDRCRWRLPFLMVERRWNASGTREPASNRLGDWNPPRQTDHERWGPPRIQARRSADGNPLRTEPTPPASWWHGRLARDERALSFLGWVHPRGQRSMPARSSTNACSRATRLSRSNRPLLPPCPELRSMSISKGCASVFRRRSLATNLAGSK
jgi:hypothetical protein